MHDILPDQAPIWQFVEDTTRAVLSGYGYSEIRFPVVEKTDLFKRTIGEVTDIVEREMYTFLDRNEESISLRPEGTAGCVRACIDNGLLHGQAQRLWYAGPMFRHERPQKGRYRQFYQIGAEAFGLDGPDIDAEMIYMTARLWRALGIADVRLEINTLGSPEARAAYRERLVEYFGGKRERLDEDCLRRLHTNPLRILDSKNPHMKDLIAGAPVMIEHMDETSVRHFDELKALLDVVGVAYIVNPRLVRGLDYYGRTVFEWITDRLGAQGTVCAGGRYDGLVAQLGGKPTPAIGFAMGLERLVAMLEESNASPASNSPHAYLVLVGEGAQRHGAQLAERLRDALPGLRLVVNCGGGSFKAQFKRADKSGAALALIIGDDEVAKNVASVKPLRGEGDQMQMDIDALTDKLGGLVTSSE